MLCADTSRKTSEMLFGQKIFSLKYFLFFKKTKIELLSSEQNERLCNFLNTRLESRLRLVSAILGDPRARNSMAPYIYIGCPAVVDRYPLNRRY